MSGKIARALANIWNSAAAISNNNSLCWPSKWDPSRRSRSTFRAKSPEDFIQTSSLLRIHVSCEDEGDFHLHLNAVKFTGISLHDFTTYDKQSSIMAIKMAICRHPRKNNFQPARFHNARWHFQSCWYLDYVSFNVHATHNNLVKSRSSFFFFFFNIRRLRGIESRPNERDDKALCNNVLSIYEPRREEFSLSCTLLVSRYVTILLIGKLLCFFSLCEKIMNVREIYYKLISKVVLCIFYPGLNLLFTFSLCSTDVLNYLFINFYFWWHIDIVNEQNQIR